MSLDDIFSVFINAIRTTTAFFQYMNDVKFYNKVYRGPIETDFMFINRHTFQESQKIKRSYERTTNLKRNTKKLVIIENFLSENQKGNIVNAKPLRYFFPETSHYSGIFFQRGYHVNFNALNRTIGKYKQKAAIAKQDHMMLQLHNSIAKSHKELDKAITTIKQQMQTDYQEGFYNPKLQEDETDSLESEFNKISPEYQKSTFSKGK